MTTTELPDSMTCSIERTVTLDNQVTIRHAGRRTLHALEHAGLRIHQVGAGWVIASVAVEDLGRVAALDAVERIAVP